MFNLQETFQHFIGEIKTLLSQAQAAGRVETYQLDVVFSRITSLKIPYDETLLEALLNILQTVQKMVSELSQHCQVETWSSSNIQVENEIHIDNRLYKRCTKTENHQEDMNFSNIKESEFIPPIDCPIKMKNMRSISKKHPTTKEKEAANVLMNLCGKAGTDRADHSIEDSTPVVFANHSMEFESKRDHIICDEVPQINEKDLLPLATQVICQFCSKQCEDLVELHEHVLAVHNIPDNEPSLVPAAKKFRIIIEEGNESTTQFSAFPIEHQKGYSINCKCMPENTPPGFVTHDESGNIHKPNSANKNLVSKQFNDKVMVHSISNPLESQEPYSVSINVVEANKRDSLHELGQTKLVIMPSKDGVSQKFELEPFLTEQLDFQTLTVVGGCENPQSSKQVENKETNLPPAVEKIPDANDALAIPVESSKIKVIEAKVIIAVCLKCCWCYTNYEDYKNHICNEDRPFTKMCPDGTVELIDTAKAGENYLNYSSGHVWYFPDFIIRELPGDVELAGSKLEIIPCISGRKLQLCSSFQPSFLSEQFISFRCPTCERECDSMSRFVEHLTRGPCMFHCPECSLSYKTQDKLQIHRASMHPNIEDRTCPNCQTVFEKRHQRNKHLKTKCSKNHICKVCGNVLKNEYNLRVHMQSHKEREHICKECGAKFHRRTILQRHMMRHSGTRPHPCTQCPAKFFTRQHLNTHLDRHNGLKRFPCSACTKAYYSKHDRDQHFGKIHNKATICEKLSNLSREEESIDDIKDD